MPYKSNEDRREKRHKEAIRVKQNRVIEGYVFHKHPEIYKKAKALYTTLDSLYPRKYDLRKTQEYERAIGKDTGRYKYLPRAATLVISHEEIVVSTNSPAVPPDNLPTVPPDNLPAVPPDNLPAVPPDNSPAVPPDNLPTVPPDNLPAVPPDNLPAVPPDNSPAVPPDNLPTVPPDNLPAVPPDNSPAVPPDNLPLLPNEIVNSIIKDLMKEPDINTFFNTMDTEFQETDLDLDMGINEGLTPLEKELM